MFCENVNKSFSENNFSSDPQSGIPKSLSYLGTIRSMNQLSNEDETKLKHLLSNINDHFKKNSLDIFTNFKDFDKNNIGLLTESQVTI
jgi:hypothetical protein